MKCWSETVPFTEPLRDVQLAEPMPAPGGDWEERAYQREMAAYERGLADGAKEIREQLLRQRTELAQPHQELLQSLRDAVPRLLEQIETDLMALALETAHRLVAGLPISADMVEAAIREALGHVDDKEVSVYLHGEDLTLLQEMNSPLLQPTTGGIKLHFHASPEVSRGGCMIHTRFGIVDGRRETRFAQIRKATGVTAPPQSLQSPAPTTDPR